MSLCFLTGAWDLAALMLNLGADPGEEEVGVLLLGRWRCREVRIIQEACPTAQGLVTEVRSSVDSCP